MAKKSNRTSKKFETKYIWQVYRLANMGLKRRAIAAELGLTSSCLGNWIRHREDVREAYEEGQQDYRTSVDKAPAEVHVQSYMDYVYGELPAPLQRLWDSIDLSYRHDKDSAVRIANMLKDKGDKELQRLFIHALVTSNFNVNFALGQMRVSRSKLDRWCRDADFASLLRSIKWYKQNWIEAALLQKIADGDTKAIIFANKTLNKARGYSEKIEVEHKGSIEHSVKLEDLDLPTAVLEKILDAIEEAEKGEKIESKTIEGAVV